MNIYFISGLGADRRAFQRLQFPEKYTLNYIDWIDPNKNESLHDYSKRLSAVIDPSVPFIIVGLSMGGMITMEIAKILKPKYIILISSVKRSSELPWYYKLPGASILIKLTPASAFKKPTVLAFWFVGTKDEDSKRMITKISMDSDQKFVKWAMHAIVKWKNKEVPQNIFHIHGTDDHILPIRFTHPDVKINEGGHFMVYSNADDISVIINAKLKELEDPVD